MESIKEMVKMWYIDKQGGLLSELIASFPATDAVLLFHITLDLVVEGELGIDLRGRYVPNTATSTKHSCFRSIRTTW